MLRAVLDTNVLVSALRSRSGPAFKLLSTVGTGRFEISVSVALVLEYEEVLPRATPLSEIDVGAVIRYLCSVAWRQKVFYLWRPFLRDPDDDMVLEVAVASRAEYIVAYNRRDFVGVERFGIRAVTPKEFLRELGD